MVIRTLCFASVLVTAVAGPFWVAVLLGLAYAAYFQGLELMLVALLVDGYFGYGRSVPSVTLATAALLLLFIALRPHLTLYNR